MFCSGAPGALVGDPNPIREGGSDPYSGIRFVYVEVLHLPGVQVAYMGFGSYLLLAFGIRHEMIILANNKLSYENFV